MSSLPKDDTKTDALSGFSIQSVNFSDQICDVVTKTILAGKLKPGDKLPSEDKLATQFKVSKTAIREALGQLVARGLIIKRRGALGGSFVAYGNPNGIQNVVINCFQLGGLSFKEIIEYRQLLEPAAAKYACDTRTDEDLEAMRLNIEACKKAMAEGNPDREKQVHFHRLIATACHNRLLTASIDAAVSISRDVSKKIDYTREQSIIDLKFNEEIFECLKKRDKASVHEILVKHFEMIKLALQFDSD